MPATATRDVVCGGNTLTVPNAPMGYSYHVTDASPYVLSYLRGTPSTRYPFPVTNMTLAITPW